MQKALLSGLIVLFIGATPSLLQSPAAQDAKSFNGLLSSQAIRETWKTVHCDLESGAAGALAATFWKGYETTGFETTSLPLADWSAWKSLKFDVTNPYDEPFSVYVRISNQPDHPSEMTYTGGTFDGFVIAPGRNTVEISLESMQSPEERAVDPKHVAYLGIFFAPLFLRDGMDLRFREDKTFQLSNLHLDAAAAKLQKQPYAEPLFAETAPGLAGLRREVEVSVSDLRGLIHEAQARGIDTAYAEIPSFLADIAFRKRLVAFWQDRVEQQREALESLQRESCRAARELREVLAGTRQPLVAPPLPKYSDLEIRDGYFRLGDEPKLIFGMLYNRQGPLLRWFANSQTDYGTQLVAGATRHNVERQPIWEIYQRYPKTHRVGWDRADHIIRDRGSWEVLGPPVNICLENPRTRQAVAQAIEDYLRSRKGRGNHLVMNLGYEYFYVCYCSITRRMWTEWLARRHKNIGAANDVWGTSYGGFSEVPMMRLETAATNRALWFDWSSFNLDRFLKQIRWTHDQIRRWEPSAPLTVGSPYYAFSPRFWTAIDEEELADSGMTGVVLQENYALDTLMPEYLHALAGNKPVADFEYHGVIHQVLPSFLHGDAAISMWWWNDRKRWTPNEPINEWASSFPQSYTISLRDAAKAMRDALDIRRLSGEISTLGNAPRPVVLLYSKTSMLQRLPEESIQTGTFPYLTRLRQTYNASQPVGIYVGLTTEKKILAGDLDRRKLLILPGAEFMPKALVSAILAWVKRGGRLIVLPDSLLADEYARPLDAMQLLGLRLRRRELPKLKREEKQVTDYNSPDLPRFELSVEPRDIFSHSHLDLRATGGRQIIECDRSLILAKFPDGLPAILKIEKGKGTIYWFSAQPVPESWAAFLSAVAPEAGIEVSLHVSRRNRHVVPEVEFRLVKYSSGHLAYLYNNSDTALRLNLETKFSFSEVTDRRTETALSGLEILLPGRETAILEFR